MGLFKLKKNIIILFIFFLVLCGCSKKVSEKITLIVYLDDEYFADYTVLKGTKLDFDLGEDYLFFGWFDESGENKIDGIVLNSDMNVVAKAIEKGTKYSIVYHMTDDAHFLNYDYPHNYEVGTKVKLVAPVRKLNYEFNGWYYEGEKIEEIPENMYGVIELYDSWIDNNVYHKVSYVDEGAISYSYEKIDTFIEGSKYELPYPIKEGYYFRGWYIDKEYRQRVYNIDENVKEDLVLYAKFEEKTKDNTYVSFVGDSISTYQGLIPEDAGTYYPIYVDFPPEKTYFLQVTNGMGYNFLKNDSYAGSRLSSDNYPNGERIPSALTDSRIKGLTDGIHDPDILIIHLGTNEYSQGITVSAFEESIGLYVNKVRKLYDDVEIYFCTHPCNRYPEQYNKVREQYNDAIFNNASKYSYSVLDLRECWTQEETSIYLYANAHPSEKGFEKMAEYIISELKKTHDFE